MTDAQLHGILAHSQDDDEIDEACAELDAREDQRRYDAETFDWDEIDRNAYQSELLQQHMDEY